MTLTVKEGRVRLDATETGLVAEASDLGIRPGAWPERIEVEFRTGRRIVFGPGRPAEGMGIELGGVEYPSLGGETRLTVFND